MCRTTSDTHGRGYVVMLGVALGVVTVALAAWWLLSPLLDE
jgi:threonine/homoserine/homoserine lactone efflux protein